MEEKTIILRSTLTFCFIPFGYVFPYVVPLLMKQLYINCLGDKCRGWETLIIRFPKKGGSHVVVCTGLVLLDPEPRTGP